MPLTTIYGDGTRIVGDANAIEQTLHPTVMAYINIMQSPTGGNYAMTLNEIDAVNNMVQALVSNGIWTKLVAIYPIIGTTATAHKFNLKDPRDADAAYRLSFLGGGWTHTANGATPNGTTSYANTFYALNSLTSGHLSVYSRSNTDGLFQDIGSSNIGVSIYNGIVAKLTNLYFGGINQTANLSATVANSTGLFLTSRTSNVQLNLYKQGILVASSSILNSTSANGNNLFIGALNTAGTPTRFSNRQYSLASFGDGLTQIESIQFYNIVQAFQTKLGRQV
jgi:hypothetical protein